MNRHLNKVSRHEIGMLFLKDLYQQAFNLANILPYNNLHISYWKWSPQFLPPSQSPNPVVKSSRGQFIRLTEHLSWCSAVL